MIRTLNYTEKAIGNVLSQGEGKIMDDFKIMDDGAKRVGKVPLVHKDRIPVAKVKSQEGSIST